MTNQQIMSVGNGGCRFPVTMESNLSSLDVLSPTPPFTAGSEWEVSPEPMFIPSVLSHTICISILLS